MELIPINESKLKIMLDESDMREYNIGDEADCANSETRLAIRHILDRAKDQIGFNTEGSEIFVQLYTSKRGGCELFVTKSAISSDSIMTSAVSGKKTKKRVDTNTPKAISDTHALPARIQAPHRSQRTDSGKVFYSFDALGDICKVCKLLDSLQLSLDSSAHKGDDGLYYLILEGDDLKEYARLDRLTFILEFGERERGYDVHTYLDEHATVICGSSAVTTLAQF